MAEISVGAAVGAGFGLIGRKPGAVLLWGLARVVFVAALIGVYLPIYIQVFSAISHSAQAGGAANPAAAFPAFAPQLMAAQMLGYLIQLLTLVL